MKIEKLKYCFQEIRPHQWVKNLLIFAPIVFVGQLLNWLLLERTILAFVSFCLIASSVYVLNDIFDLKEDRQHSKKRNRPLASGEINLIEAKILSFFLFIFGIGLAYYVSQVFLVILLFYFAFNFFYSWRLKHLVVLDLMMVAAMYLIRVYAGAVVINVPVSNWLLLTTLFIALFIAIAKRRTEIVANQNNGDIATRRVLSDYSVQFLDYLLIITNVATLVFYALYAMTRGGLFVWSILFVIYAMFRYLWIVFIKRKGEEPEKLLLKDRPIFFSILAWGIFVILILYL